MILVTGATGNAGREVLAALLARGLPARAATRSGDHPDAPAGRLGLADPASWDAALSGVTGLFLMLPPGQPPASVAAFARAARDRGARAVTFMSVQGIESSPWLPHRAVERALPPGATILRPGFFAQNLAEAYRRDLIEDDRLSVPAGRARVAWLDLRDLGEAAALVLADPGPQQGRAYALTGQVSETFANAARHLTAALGRPIRYEPATAWGYWAHLRRRGVPALARLILLRLHLGLRWGEGDRPTPDLARLLGRPSRALGDYVRDHADLWRKPLAAPGPLV